MENRRQASQIETLYWTNIGDVDEIFKTSNVLLAYYKQALRRLYENVEFTTHQKQQLVNAIQGLENIGKVSLNKSEKTAWKRLFLQSVILIVSISEQILKEAFEKLLFKNIEKIDKLPDVTFSKAELLDCGFKLDRSKIAEAILRRVAVNLDPSEKLNFQNIRSIQEIFKNYFKIDLGLSTELEKKIHLFYQLRHAIVHNAGFTDQRFLDNLRAAKIEKEYILGEKIEIKKVEFEECKNCFGEFFAILDSKIGNSGLEFDLVEYEQDPVQPVDTEKIDLTEPTTR